MFITLAILAARADAQPAFDRDADRDADHELEPADDRALILDHDLAELEAVSDATAERAALLAAPPGDEPRAPGSRFGQLALAVVWRRHLEDRDGSFALVLEWQR